MKALAELRALAFQRTNLRYQNGSAAKDLFYYLVWDFQPSLCTSLTLLPVQSNEDNAEAQSPPRDIVVSDGVLAIIAGSDTTATSLSNIFFHLLNNRDCYRRLQAEVDEYYPPGENALDPQHHPRMPYLDAVM